MRSGQNEKTQLTATESGKEWLRCHIQLARSVSTLQPNQPQLSWFGFDASVQDASTAASPTHLTPRHPPRSRSTVRLLVSLTQHYHHHYHPSSKWRLPCLHLPQRKIKLRRRILIAEDLVGVACRTLMWPLCLPGSKNCHFTKIQSTKVGQTISNKEIKQVAFLKSLKFDRAFEYLSAYFEKSILTVQKMEKVISSNSESVSVTRKPVSRIQQ